MSSTEIIFEVRILSEASSKDAKTDATWRRLSFTRVTRQVRLASCQSGGHRGMKLDCIFALTSRVVNLA